LPVAIVTDTCHYLARELIERHQIHQVSLYVRAGNETLREIDIDNYDEYYERLRDMRSLPTTSQPSIGDFLAVYEPLLQDGMEIVSVHLAGGMSGTVRSAEQAREQLGERAGRVRVVDSRSACGGEGLVVLAAAAAARAGGDAEAVERRALEAVDALQMWFSIDTLEYLRRGGRIAGAQAWLGSALRIKPILTVKGEITPVERVRTSRRAFERMLELVLSLAEAGGNAYMVQHIQWPERAAEMSARATEIMGRRPIATFEIGPVIGTHVGPGLLGVGGIPSSLLNGL
jgi:DegV family protein with EDD domain